MFVFMRGKLRAMGYKIPDDSEKLSKGGTRVAATHLADDMEAELLELRTDDGGREAPGPGEGGIGSPAWLKYIWTCGARSGWLCIASPTCFIVRELNSRSSLRSMSFSSCVSPRLFFALLTSRAILAFCRSTRSFFVFWSSSSFCRFVTWDERSISRK